MHPTVQSAPPTAHIPISTYLLVTFGSAWLLWLPLLVAQYTCLKLPLPSNVLITLGSFVPTITVLFLEVRRRS